MKRRDFITLIGGAAVPWPFAPRVTRAQAYPARPVHILVGLAAGGPTDAAARILAEWLSQQFGQQFLVENRTGMAGNLTKQAFRITPDHSHEAGDGVVRPLEQD